MKIGALSETVPVSGQSPVVDTVNVAGQTTLVQDQLRSIPMGGTMQEMLPLAAGLSMQTKPDVGDSNLASRSAIITYGVVLQATLDVEGIKTVTAHDADTAVYLNSFALQEAQFKTSGNNAEIAYPGVAQVAVMKSGSNTFHGSARGSYENPRCRRALGALSQFLSGADEGGGAVQRDLPGEHLSQAGRSHLGRYGAARGRVLGRSGKRQDCRQGFLRDVRRHDGRSLFEQLQPE
jgi:hypothetical protein